MPTLSDPRHTLWVLPLLAVGLAWLMRSIAGEPVTVLAALGAIVVGFASAAVCMRWHGGIVEQVEMRLGRRTTELVRSQEFVRNLVDASPDAIVATDLEGVVTFYGAAAERLLGWTREDAIGHQFAEFFVNGEEGASDLRRRFDKQGGALVNERCLLRTAEQNALPVSLSLTKLLDEDGKAKGVLAVVRDISERVRVEEEQMQAERLRVLGESLAGIAHELNNPLTAVSGLLEVSADAVPEEVAQRLSHALDECRRMSRTIRTMLAFARRHELDRSATDVTRLVYETLDLLAIDLRRSGIDLRAEIGALPVCILDPHQIRQVLINLVTNARDAVAGQADPGITVRCSDTGTTLHFEVADNGPGVPPEARAKLFEAFYTTKVRGRGSGLGLAICREFVEAHAGTLHLEETPGGGATFIFDLPRLVAAEAAEELGHEDEDDDDTTDRIATATDIAPRRVLVVEDEPGIAIVCRVALSSLCQATIVSDPREALEIVESAEFDAILSDVRLSPTLTGFDLLDTALDRRPELMGRVAVMTGDTEDAETVAAARTRGLPMLAKPFTVPDLREFVTALLCGVTPRSAARVS